MTSARAVQDGAWTEQVVKKGTGSAVVVVRKGDSERLHLRVPTTSLVRRAAKGRTKKTR